jgi:hypothetical protein
MIFPSLIEGYKTSREVWHYSTYCSYSYPILSKAYGMRHDYHALHGGQALHTSTVARRPLQLCLEDRILFMLVGLESTPLEVCFTM